jgi:hypothetical protein
MTPQDLEQWQNLKRDAMAAFCLSGLLANPSLSYLTPSQMAEKAITYGDTLLEMLSTEINPQE